MSVCVCVCVCVCVVCCVGACMCRTYVHHVCMLVHTLKYAYAWMCSVCAHHCQSSHTQLYVVILIHRNQVNNVDELLWSKSVSTPSI